MSGCCKVHYVLGTVIFVPLFSGRMSFKYDCYGYYERDGLPLVGAINPIERIEACINYEKLQDDDVYLLTYPKSGKLVVKSPLDCHTLQISHCCLKL